MKLIQLNAWGGRLEYALNDFIEAEKPDILCLQEIIDIKGGRASLFSSVEDLCKIMGSTDYYMSPVFTFNFMHRKADFGNCIISKFPIISKNTLFTGREYVKDFDWTKHTQNIRNLQYAEIQLPSSKSLHVFNHHGHHIHEHKNGDLETMRQMKIIGDEIKAHSGKIILTGDFNLVPKSESIEQINKVLRNLTLEAKLKTTRTALTHKTEVCDYIFASKDVKVKSFGASEALASDHQALIVNFE